jgi:GGDEF domain-containing protein
VVPLDTRSDWNAALRHEEARVVRYGRPAAVLIVDIGSRQPGRIDRIAEKVGSTVRHQARETDRVARISPSRFHVLLPETHEADADVLAERVRRACAEITVAPAGLGVIVQIASASPMPGETLGDALRAAERRLAS